MKKKPLLLALLLLMTVVVVVRSSTSQGPDDVPLSTEDEATLAAKFRESVRYGANAQALTLFSQMCERTAVYYGMSLPDFLECCGPSTNRFVPSANDTLIYGSSRGAVHRSQQNGFNPENGPFIQVSIAESRVVSVSTRHASGPPEPGWRQDIRGGPPQKRIDRVALYCRWGCAESKDNHEHQFGPEESR